MASESLPARSWPLLARLRTGPKPPPEPRPVVRLTRKNRRVLLVLLSGATNLYGFTICQAGGVPSGTVTYLLFRLEDAAWVTGEWGPVFNGDMRRRFYSLTDKGRTEAYALLGLEAPQ